VQSAIGLTLAILGVNVWAGIMWIGLFPRSWRTVVGPIATRPFFGSGARGSSGWVGRAASIAAPWGAIALDCFLLAGPMSIGILNLLGALASIVFVAVALFSRPRRAVPAWFREWVATRTDGPEQVVTSTEVASSPPLLVEDQPVEDPLVEDQPEVQGWPSDAKRKSGWTLWAAIAAILATVWALLWAFAWLFESDLGWSSWPPGSYLVAGVETLGVFLGPVALLLGLLFPFHSWRWGIWLTWPQVFEGFSIHRGCPIACTGSDLEPVLMPFALLPLICVVAWLAAAVRRRISPTTGATRS